MITECRLQDQTTRSHQKKQIENGLDRRKNQKQQISKNERQIIKKPCILCTFVKKKRQDSIEGDAFFMKRCVFFT